MYIAVYFIMSKTIRNLCGCGKRRFIGENVISGKILCACRQLNEIEDSVTVKAYPNKLAYQDRQSINTIKK